MKEEPVGAIHMVARVLASLIVAAMVIGGGVFLYNYFNSAKKDIVANDITIVVEQQGTGVGAKIGDTVDVNYIGTFQDGTQFDNSYKRGAPISVTLGEGQVIKGWEEGLLGIKQGEKRLLTIPPTLAYGASGYPDGNGGYAIPPNSTLVFEVEAVSIKAQ